MKALLLNPDVEYSDGYENNRDNYIQCEVLAYDRDKYVLCKLPDGVITEYKSGYLKRVDNFGQLTYRQLFSLPVLNYDNYDDLSKPTKRQVQKELKDNYKLKTEFTLYVSNEPVKDPTTVITTSTLKQAVRVFRKYQYAQLSFSTDRWNTEGIAEREKKDGILYYDIDRRTKRPTYSAKVLRELEK